MLRQDPALETGPRPETAPATAAERRVLVRLSGADEDESLLRLAEALVSAPEPRELILVRLVEAPSDLRRVAASLGKQREAFAERGVAARSAAFTTSDWAEDLLRLVGEQEVELLLLAGLPESDADLPASALGRVLDAAPCDVGILAGAGGRPGGPALVPFGGGEHDWAALELGAWYSAAAGSPLVLVGPLAEPERGKRDASRLLAQASLIVQRFLGVTAEPLLTPPGPDAVVEAARDAGIVVVGLSERWRAEGVGEVRRSVAERVAAPVLLARRGLRPGGLAPAATLTRFTWSLRETEPEDSSRGS
jgi:hypothetical protein